MKTIVIAALAGILAGSVTNLPAQAQGRGGAGQPAAAAVGEIRGTIVDAEGKTPIASASVAIWTKGNVLVAGALTRQDGTFRIEGLLPGAYTVKVTMIGYDSHTSAEVAISPSAARFATGTIGLARSPIALRSVEVNAERTVVIAPDRNAYRARDIAPAATNASDVLQATPSVQVDPDGKVSLRGNENVVVQINGRPTPIRGAQLAGYLKQLPANTIERIEVIPNPSAKYDPEGMAGIINIVMKQGVDLGRSGGLTLDSIHRRPVQRIGQFRLPGRSAEHATDVRLQQHGAGSSWHQRPHARSIRCVRRFRSPSRTSTAQTANRGHNLNATVDCRLNQRNVLYSTVLANRRKSSDESLTAYDELNGSRSVLAQYDRSP